ncbi:hypothetical protein EV426DRAFT_578002 [Tirmania nivea]|nr:hypothetical protein EV426DRAFT_578002 [Tirmania nivea]
MKFHKTKAPSPRSPLPCGNYYSVLNIPWLEPGNDDCSQLPAAAALNPTRPKASPRCFAAQRSVRRVDYEETVDSTDDLDSPPERSGTESERLRPRRRRRPIFAENLTPCLEPTLHYDQVLERVREVYRLSSAFHQKLDAWKLRPSGSLSGKILRAQIDKLVPQITEMTQQVVLDAAFLKLSAYEGKLAQSLGLNGVNDRAYSQLNFKGIQGDSIYVAYRYQRAFSLRGGWVASEEPAEVDPCDLDAQLNPYNPANQHINWVVCNLEDISRMIPGWG